MIFVTVGTGKGDFWRLFEAIDQLIAEKVLRDVEAQIGHSAGHPRNFKYTQFLRREEMSSFIRNAEFVISHGGVGTLDECLGLKKKVIVFPRLPAFNEIADDHQLRFATHLAAKNRVLMATDMPQLRVRLAEVRCWEPSLAVISGPNSIIETINGFIDGKAPDKSCSEFATCNPFPPRHSRL